jgi:hypothetical protein
MIYLPPSLRGFVNRRTVFSTWIDHLPFGYDLVEALRPRTIVELGSQAGMSYFAFCQSVQAHGLPTRCWAVDTWAGDEHTGEYGDEVYRDVAAHNDAHYASFSELLRMRFEDAIGRFDDESIELLHIDGFHTYDAVSADFAAWYPKVAPGGVVLFHDIAARMMDFGAWRFWDELSRRHEAFTFRHGFGLGVLRKPGGPAPDAPLLGYLFSGDPETEQRLRAFYVYAARHVDLVRQRAAIETLREKIRQKREAARGE